MALRVFASLRGLARFLPLGVACALAAFPAACQQSSTDLPGTSLGTYNVTGQLGTNSCGAGLGAPNPWTFTAQMSEDGTTFYWEPAGGSSISNTMASSTEVSITDVETANVDGTDAGEGPCDMTSTTSVNLKLATGAPPSTFSGTVSYTFAASTGVSTTTDCTDQLSASGGQYDTLPCTVTYSIVGQHQ